MRHFKACIKTNEDKMYWTFTPCGCGTNKHIVSTSSSTLAPKRAIAPPPHLQLNDWPNTGIITPHGKLFLLTHVTRGPTHGLDDQCRICVEEVLCCFHVAQHLPHCSLEEPERREMSHRKKEWCWFLALPGVSTHIDFLYRGSQELEDRIDVFLRIKAVDVHV